MSDATHSNPAAGFGPFVLLGAATAESVGGVSLWTQFFALAGFIVTLLSALPKIVEGAKLLSGWAAKVAAYSRRQKGSKDRTGGSGGR